MVDKISKEVRRRNMQAIKGTHTKLENCVIKELWNKGIRFRRNVKDLVGKPDIAIKKYKIVIFIDSCFWHGCKIHYRIPLTNIDFWTQKINKNIERDLKVNNYYENNGWHVLRVWEHEIEKTFDESIVKIIEFIDNFRN